MYKITNDIIHMDKSKYLITPKEPVHVDLIISIIKNKPMDIEFQAI